MHNPLLMGGFHTTCDSGNDARGLARRQWTTIETACKSLAFNVLHAKIRTAFVFADLEHCDDVRMHEPGGRGGFSAESCPIGIRCECPMQHHFQRNEAIQTLLPG